MRPCYKGELAGYAENNNYILLCNIHILNDMNIQLGWKSEMFGKAKQSCKKILKYLFIYFFEDI